MSTAKTKAAKKAIKKTKASGPATIIAAARAAAYTDEHPQRAFEHFKPAAEQVSLTDLPVFTGQPLLMRVNVLAALSALEEHLPTAIERMRAAPLRDLFELPALTMALDYAVTRVPVMKLSAREIDGMLEEGGPWRELMLSYLEVASHPLLGLLPAERVRAVRAGSGKLDKARDFVSISGLFSEFAEALSGKHPFASDKVAMLGTLGAALVQQVRPGRAPQETPKRGAESILRDRFAALVEARYDALQVLAAVAVGKRKADALLPALRSAVAFGAAAEAGAEAAAPVATDGAPE